MATPAQINAFRQQMQAKQQAFAALEEEIGTIEREYQRRRAKRERWFSIWCISWLWLEGLMSAHSALIGEFGWACWETFLVLFFAWMLTRSLRTRKEAEWLAQQ